MFTQNIWNTKVFQEYKYCELAFMMIKVPIWPFKFDDVRIIEPPKDIYMLIGYQVNDLTSIRGSIFRTYLVVNILKLNLT